MPFGIFALPLGWPVESLGTPCQKYEDWESAQAALQEKKDFFAETPFLQAVSENSITIMLDDGGVTYYIREFPPCFEPLGGWVWDSHVVV
jgi:hypothetical protein